MIVIYTDGSAKGNGNKNAVGGYGVVVYQGLDSDHLNIIDAYQEQEVGTTNNRMEIKAILWAMKNYGQPGQFFPPIVYSDSMYCVNSFNNWINSWRCNGWKRAKNKELENKDLIMEYDNLLKQGYSIDLRYVKGHNETIGNELADGLATGALTVQEVLNGQF